jgi:hypothetical protein
MKRFVKSRHPSLFGILLQCRDFAKKPITSGKIYFDLWSTRSEAKEFRKSFRGIPFQEGKTVLIPSISDFIYQIKLEAYLALELRRRGYRIVILTNSRSNVVSRMYFAAFGIRDFLFMDEIPISSNAKNSILEACRNFLNNKKLNFHEVKKWMYGPSWIGPQILSTVARSTFKGAPDPSDPDTFRRISEELPLTLERVEKAKDFFEQLKPDLVYVIESNYTLMGPVIDVAIEKKINVIQVVQPSRDDGMYFKRLNKITRRFHPVSLSPETMDEMKKIPWKPADEAALQEEFSFRYSGKWFLQSRNQPNTKPIEKAQLISDLGLDPNKKTAAVFSHILWDANLFYGEDLCADYEDWYVKTLLAAKENSQLNWIIKLHPANLWKRARDNATGKLSEMELIEKHLGKVPNHIFLIHPDSKISTLSLFEILDYAVTVRGTTGYEAPCFGVHTLTAGTGRYSGLGFTDDSSSEAEYLEKLKNLQNVEKLSLEKTELAKKHALAIFRKRVWTIKSFKASFQYKKKGHHPLDHNAHLTARNWRQVDQNKDLSLWADWAVEKKTIDYLDL